MTIPTTSGESGYADVTQWPDACAFVSKADLTESGPRGYWSARRDLGPDECFVVQNVVTKLVQLVSAEIDK
ncbi:hypothetical protein [Actinoallomurus iriomotensis]|uniref:hypothetical protein n=1 Tax=Actinoallomurus iriomotensis TaxID=478107 RepID=UPI0025573739|nr:hypothetical protein [Actinoallomurus iriomotensis]